MLASVLCTYTRQIFGDTKTSFDRPDGLVRILQCLECRNKSLQREAASSILDAREELLAQLPNATPKRLESFRKKSTRIQSVGVSPKQNAAHTQED